MYLVHSNNADDLRELTNSLDAIDDFIHCDLGRLNILELTELCDDASRWIAGQPVVYDESNGLAIFSFSQSGVDYGAVLEYTTFEYWIEAGRSHEPDWESHVLAKGWPKPHCDTDFIEALSYFRRMTR